MESKYILLKSGRGIVIFLEMDEIKNPVPLDSDEKISSRIFFRLDSSIPLSIRDMVLKFFVSGLRALSDVIQKKIGDCTVCFLLKKIDFNEAHFQEEGLYCAAQEWVAKYYDISISPTSVEFDQNQNKYIFKF